ncbi:hypothetical protein OIV55_12710 [Burkholderia pseudomallei]|uniref:hypothetical protein n=1 Tax=Burkholderia pseudomallei TaxID=28450 RepID=UPI0021F78006|nr:hypothetical protein [Burkholderia pseudomallei]MCW0023926.1 hypothetical protein [Burkholderia pseudomallei]
MPAIETGTTNPLFGLNDALSTGVAPSRRGSARSPQPAAINATALASAMLASARGWKMETEAARLGAGVDANACRTMGGGCVMRDAMKGRTNDTRRIPRVARRAARAAHVRSLKTICKDRRFYRNARPHVVDFCSPARVRRGRCVRAAHCRARSDIGEHRSTAPESRDARPAAQRRGPARACPAHRTRDAPRGRERITRAARRFAKR